MEKDHVNNFHGQSLPQDLSFSSLPSKPKAVIKNTNNITSSSSILSLPLPSSPIISQDLLSPIMLCPPPSPAKTLSSIPLSPKLSLSPVVSSSLSKINKKKRQLDEIDGINDVEEHPVYHFVSGMLHYTLERLLVNPSKKSTSISSSKISSSLPIPDSLQCNNTDQNNNSNNNNNNNIKTLKHIFHKHGFKTATVHSSNHIHNHNEDRDGGSGSNEALSVYIDPSTIKGLNSNNNDKNNNNDNLIKDGRDYLMLMFGIHSTIDECEAVYSSSSSYSSIVSSNSSSSSSTSSSNSIGKYKNGNNIISEIYHLILLCRRLLNIICYKNNVKNINDDDINITPQLKQFKLKIYNVLNELSLLLPSSSYNSNSSYYYYSSDNSSVLKNKKKYQSIQYMISDIIQSAYIVLINSNNNTTAPSSNDNQEQQKQEVLKPFYNEYQRIKLRNTTFSNALLQIFLEDVYSIKIDSINLRGGNSGDRRRLTIQVSNSGRNNKNFENEDDKKVGFTFVPALRYLVSSTLASTSTSASTFQKSISPVNIVAQKMVNSFWKRMALGNNIYGKGCNNSNGLGGGDLGGYNSKDNNSCIGYGGYLPTTTLRNEIDDEILSFFKGGIVVLDKVGRMDDSLPISLEAHFEPTYPLSLYLHGEAGSGKSAFARNMSSSLRYAIQDLMDPEIMVRYVKQNLNKPHKILELELELRPNNNDLSVMSLIQGRRMTRTQTKPGLVVVALEEMSKFWDGDSRTNSEVTDDVTEVSISDPNQLRVARLVGFRFSGRKGNYDIDKGNDNRVNIVSSRSLLPRNSSNRGIGNDDSLPTVFTSNYKLHNESRKALTNLSMFRNLKTIKVEAPSGCDRMDFARLYLKRAILDCRSCFIASEQTAMPVEPNELEDITNVEFNIVNSRIEFGGATDVRQQVECEVVKLDIPSVSNSVDCAGDMRQLVKELRMLAFFACSILPNTVKREIDQIPEVYGNNVKSDEKVTTFPTVATIKQSYDRTISPMVKSTLEYQSPFDQLLQLRMGIHHISTDLTRLVVSVTEANTTLDDISPLDVAGSEERSIQLQRFGCTSSIEMNKKSNNINNGSGNNILLLPIGLASFYSYVDRRVLGVINTIRKGITDNCSSRDSLYFNEDDLKKLACILDYYYCGILAPAVVVSHNADIIRIIISAVTCQRVKRGGKNEGNNNKNRNRACAIMDVHPSTHKMMKSLYDARDTWNLRDEIIKLQQDAKSVGSNTVPLVAVELCCSSFNDQMQIREIIEDSPSMTAFSSENSALYKAGLLFVIQIDGDITPEILSRASLVL